MGHCVVYVVDLPGVQFNPLLENGHQASPADFKRYTDLGIRWEGVLDQTCLSIGVELSGCITIVDLPIKYSRYLYNEKEAENVRVWESQLRRVVTNDKIVRMDELLFDQWEIIVHQSRSDKFWFRRPELSIEFFKWIETQNAEGWAYVPF
jgi:hypothetical protein